MTREVLGHIDCPCCGTAKGMRITADKNGAPFGYCEANCNVQMRIGGDARRVAAFVARYPWAAGKPVEAAKPVPALAPAQEAAQAAQPKPPAKPKASGNPFAFLMEK